MLTKKTIGFIGAGNLAEALIKGLISSGSVKAAQVTASDRASARLLHIAERYEIKVYNNNLEVARSSDIIFITVKPADVRHALQEIAPEIGRDRLLISAAAGITTSSIHETLREAGLRHFLPIVRAMPNTPATVQEGATAICAGIGAGRAELKLASAVFSSVGKSVIVEDENLMDSVTGLSGSGPAYFFLFMEALMDAGVKAGLTPESARTLTLQTALGSARLAMESSSSLAELRRMVSSPGGTTIEGLKKFEEAGLRAIVEEAVNAAVRRSKELSGANGPK